MNRRYFIDQAFFLSVGIMGRKAFALSPMISSVKGQSSLSFNDAFVTVSKKNPFYFELSSGEPFIVNGPCIAGAADMATMESYIKNLSANGGNFARVWLSNKLFEVEKKFGEYSEEQAIKIDTLLAWAVKYKIKIKLCLDNTRQIIPDTVAWFNKPQYHTEHGGPFKNVDEYINTEAGRQAYLKRIDFLQRRYNDHPAVFGWELWNEMNGIMCDGLREWNAVMLPKVHQKFKKNLVLQSLGSFDMESRRDDYRYINQLPSNDVGQIHRYIDEGATLNICTAPMDVLATDAINELRSYHIQKPMLLAEVGAVLANHSGSSDLYALDKDGALLHDMLFAPFFSGAAGTGNSWHWDTYIDENNLWYHYKRFNNAVRNINPVEEQFVPVKMYHERFRIYALVGQRTVLAWCRDIKNDWKSEFRKGLPPEVINKEKINFSNLASSLKAVNLYDPWLDKWTTAKSAALVSLPDFKRSIVIKLEKRA
jgi:hypothetical protein